MCVAARSLGLTPPPPPEPDAALVAELEASRRSFDPCKPLLTRVQLQPRGEGAIGEAPGKLPCVPPMMATTMVMTLTCSADHSCSSVDAGVASPVCVPRLSAV